MTLYHHDQIAEIAGKIKDMQFAMLTTANDDNVLSSRPLASREIDEEGCLWLFTSDEPAFVADLTGHPGVNVSYADPRRELYLSLSGRATLQRDPARAAALWEPQLRTWFPGGYDDPHLALLRVRIQSAEYWDAGTSKMCQLLAVARAGLTGERPGGIGRHTAICL